MELDSVKKQLERQGFEYYEGDYINGTQAYHFIRGTEIINILYTEWADEESLEEIKGIKKQIKTK